MKIAEAITRISAIRKELNGISTVAFSQGTETIKPPRLEDAVLSRAALLLEISRLKTRVALTNATTTVNFLGANISLSQALNLLDAMREEKSYLETYVVPSLKNATPTRTVRRGSDWEEEALTPNFTPEEAFNLVTRLTKTEADIQSLTSLVNFTNWNTELA